MPLYKCAGKSTTCLMRGSVPDTPEGNVIVYILQLVSLANENINRI